MKVSVIIPVFNVENYLETCIDSVVMQTYKNMEILLLNDGSTDQSQQVCETYQKKYPFIKLINKANEGLSATRNEGINLSTGEYLIFLDSDDYWDKNFLSDLMDRIDQANALEYIFFRYKNYRQKSDCFEEEQLSIKREEITSRTGVDVLAYILQTHKDFHWSACRGMIKKDFLIKHNLFFEVGRNYEDALWTPNVFLHAKKIDYYDEAIYIYRLERDGQITSDVSVKNLQDNVYVAKYWHTKLNKETIDTKTKELILGNTTTRYFYAVWFSGFVEPNERNAVIQVLKEKALRQMVLFS